MIIFIYVFMLFFTPFLGEWVIEGKVKKENYIQSFKLCLFLFIIFSIPLFIYWLQNRGIPPYETNKTETDKQEVKK